jgi:hypothetical protein
MTVADIDAEIARLTARRAELTKPQWPRTIEYHLNQSKDTNRWYGEEKLGLSDEVIDEVFCRCCYEVTLTLVVNEDGSAVATKLNGIDLMHPVTVSSVARR